MIYLTPEDCHLRRRLQTRNSNTPSTDHAAGSGSASTPETATLSAPMTTLFQLAARQDPPIFDYTTQKVGVAAGSKLLMATSSYCRISVFVNISVGQ